MAQDQNKTPSGGNKPKPKPGGASAGGGNQSAKDKSRAQSRPVGTKAPTGKAAKSQGSRGPTSNGSGAGKGGNKPRPGGRSAPAPAPRRLSGAMMAWGAVGLVVIIIVVLVVVKATNSTDTSYTPVTPAPASVVKDVTSIPLSVYNTVGVSSPTVPVNPPTLMSNSTPPLTLSGKAPTMLYIGAEYCPYCAAERWAMAAALSRFGTWSGLQVTASSHTDTDPSTHTFSFRTASFTSPYIHFTSVEAETNIPASAGGYTNLQNPTKAELQTYATDGSKYFPSSYQPGALSFPFVNVNNIALISGPSYDPGILAGQSWTQIASGLNDPSNPATQAIVTTANYISAVICASSKGAPASVCTSSGVMAAAKALKLG